jgi:3-oxoacyl-[acyl-carrier protein] reductase
VSDVQVSIDPGLAGKAALVVGTGEGMGQAIVAALASAGAKVACVDLDGAAAEAAAKIAEAAGTDAISRQVDATDLEQVEGAVAAAQEAFGSIDVVVNVVGDGLAGTRLLDTEEADWNRVFALCLQTATNAAKAGIGPVADQGRGGSFVFISSIGGLTGLPGQAPYSAAKAGLNSFVRTLALEYGMEGIRFNTVAPGFIITPEIERISTPEHRAEQERLIPLRRGGRPEDVARAVLFLASDLGSYVSGQTLVVDGAVTAKYQLPAFWATWEDEG